MGEQSGLYHHPEYYQSFFKRNYATENDFLEECLRRHGSATERSMVELGCGPALNSRDFARRGYRSVALDLEPRMLEHAQSAARTEGVSIETVQGNLIDFELAQPVSMAICMWDTVLVVVRNADMVRHLRAVSRNLLPGGVYVIETSHPRSNMAAYSGLPFRGTMGDLDLEMTWGLPDDPYDCIEQRYLTTVHTVARRGGEVVMHSEESLAQRYYGIQELRALIDLSGAFSEVHYYGRTTLPPVPLSQSEECNGAITVLVKGA
ncbi:MAG: class I SAM-dependent methyltransferase [Polyangia bacterium]